MKTSTSFHISLDRLRFLFICGLGCVGGCTVPGSSIQVKQAPVASLAQYKVVAVDITTKDLDFSPKQVELLTGSIVDGLRKSARFDKVYSSPKSDERDADLKLSVLVEFVLLYNVKSIEGSVVLTDTGDGKALASAQVNAHSEAALFGGQMTNAISKLSDQIVDFTTRP